MFIFIVTIFLIINGNPSEVPFRVMRNDVTFQTKENCMNFINTEEGAKAAAFIERIKSQKHFVIKSSCEFVDDGSI